MREKPLTMTSRGREGGEEGRKEGMCRHAGKRQQQLCKIGLVQNVVDGQEGCIVQPACFDFSLAAVILQITGKHCKDDWHLTAAWDSDKQCSE